MPLCGLVVAVTRERIRQIEAKALRKVSHLPLRQAQVISSTTYTNNAAGETQRKERLGKGSRSICELT
jgi:hypothetical protein